MAKSFSFLSEPAADFQVEQDKQQQDYEEQEQRPKGAPGGLGANGYNRRFRGTVGLDLRGQPVTRNGRFIGS